MAFEPVLPGPSDYLRDPLGSLGRLVQVLNYRIDQWNAMGRDIPVLKARLAGYGNTLRALPANASRQAVVDQLTQTQHQLDEFVAKRNSLGGKVIDAISNARAEIARLGRAFQVTGVSQPIIITPIVIAVVGIAVYGISQLVRDWLAIVAQDRSLGSRVLAYAQTQKLTPAQTQALANTLNKLPKPEGSKDPLASLEAMLPYALGLAAVFIFGPTLAGLVRSRRAV